MFAQEKISIPNPTWGVFNLGVTKSDGKGNAFDSTTDGTEWQIGKSTAADESSRTYDAGFIVDLGAIYTVTQIYQNFEGACSENFTLSVAGEDGVFGSAIYTGGKTGINSHTETWSGSETGVRYVKFFSTKAATQYGVKLYDFSVTGTKTADIASDDIAPVITAGSIKTLADESITLGLSATESGSKFVTYEISATDVAARHFTAKSGEETTIVFDELKEGTTYNFAIYALDSKGNRSAIKDDLSGTTTGVAFPAPSTYPEAPTEEEENVLAVFSDTYEKGITEGNVTYGVTGIPTSPLWKVEETVSISGHNVVHVKGYGFNSRSKNSVRFTKDAYDKAVVYLYPKTATSGRIFKDNSYSSGVTFTGLTPMQWNKVEVDIDFGVNNNSEDGQNPNYFLVALDDEKEFYLDHYYFYKVSAPDTESPVMTKAVVASVGHNTATLTVSATDNRSALTYTVKQGETIVGSGSGTQGADATVIISGLTAETTYPIGTFTVIATDAAGNKSTSINVPEFTTTEEPEIESESGTGNMNEHDAKFSYEFVQTGTEVTVTFSITDNGTASGVATGQTYDVTANSFLDGNTRTWTDCTPGQVIRVSCWWACEGGRLNTPTIEYIVKGMAIGAEDVDGVVAVTGTITSANKRTVEDIDSKVIDISSAVLDPGITSITLGVNQLLLVNSTSTTVENDKNEIASTQLDQLTGNTQNVIVTNSGYYWAAKPLNIVDDNDHQPFTKLINTLAQGYTITRSIATGKYVTSYFPAEGTIKVENATIYALDTENSTTSSVKFVKVDDMTSATPYVLHTTGAATVTTTGTGDLNLGAEPASQSFAGEPAAATFKGNIKEKAGTGAEYGLQNATTGVTLGRIGTGAKIGAFRAYFTGLAPAGARAIFDDLDGTTSIKKIEDILNQDDVYYNLNGQRVLNPTKGIYILNGKKVIVK